MSEKPKFTIKRKGYDRHTVDSHISHLRQELEFSEAKLNVYRKQLDFLTEQLELKGDQNINLMNEIRLLQENTGKLELVRDADNNLVTVAQKTADDIILEALMIAKEILDTLAYTSSSTKDYKEELVSTLSKILNEVQDIQIIEPLNLDLEID